MWIGKHSKEKFCSMKSTKFPNIGIKMLILAFLALGRRLHFCELCWWNFERQISFSFILLVPFLWGWRQQASWVQWMFFVHCLCEKTKVAGSADILWGLCMGCCPPDLLLAGTSHGQAEEAVVLPFPVLAPKHSVRCEQHLNTFLFHFPASVHSTQPCASRIWAGDTWGNMRGQKDSQKLSNLASKC